MAYRTRRENRYLRLRQHGFLKFEARPLSRVPVKVCPYFRDMMKERQAQMRKSQKMGRTLKQFEDSIKELYWTNNWLKENRIQQIVVDPWQMFRDAEDKFKAKNPKYESPWMPRQRKLRDFISKVERTLAKQKGE